MTAISRERPTASISAAAANGSPATPRRSWANTSSSPSRPRCTTATPTSGRRATRRRPTHPVSGPMVLTQINTVMLGYEYLDTKTTVDDSSATGNTSTFFNGPTQNSRTTGHQVTATYTRDVQKNLTAGLTGAYATRDEETDTRRNFTRESVSLFGNYVLPETLILRSSIGVARVEGDTGSGRPLV